MKSATPREACARSPADNEPMTRIQAGSQTAVAHFDTRLRRRGYRVDRAVSVAAVVGEDAVRDGFVAIWKAGVTSRRERETARDLKAFLTDLPDAGREVIPPAFSGDPSDTSPPQSATRRSEP